MRDQAKLKATRARYDKSEKGKARKARYHKSATKRENSRRYRITLALEGKCTRCGKGPALGAQCWDCLSRLEDLRAITK